MLNGIEFRRISLPIAIECNEAGHVARDQHQHECLPFSTLAVHEVRGFLRDPRVKEKYRRKDVDFSRDRCFTFSSLAITILKDRARSAQDRIIRIFEEGAFGDYPTCPTASAFYQARAKLVPTFFKDWASIAINSFYTMPSAASLVKKFHGRLLWSIDCSYLNLPDKDETRRAYIVHRNSVPGSETIQGLASFAYDVLNDFPVSTALGTVQFEPNFMINHHQAISYNKPIILYDRAYANYDTIAQTLNCHADFVIRCPLTQSFKVIEEFNASGVIDSHVQIKVTSNKNRLAKERGWPLEVQVRLVKIMLDDGNVEILLTSLLDQEEYPAHEFKWLYGKRWGVEVGFLRFKVQLEVECFSSSKDWNILQDFYATIFIQVFESILNKAHDHDILARSKEKALKHEYHVNKAVAYTSLSVHLVSLFLLENNALELSLAAIQMETRLCASPIRPGRHYSREIPKVARNLKYHKYEKKRR